MPALCPFHGSRSPSAYGQMRRPLAPGLAVLPANDVAADDAVGSTFDDLRVFYRECHFPLLACRTTELSSAFGAHASSDDTFQFRQPEALAAPLSNARRSRLLKRYDSIRPPALLCFGAYRVGSLFTTCGDERTPNIVPKIRIGRNPVAR